MKKVFITLSLSFMAVLAVAQTSFRKFLPVNDGYSNTAIDVKRANDGGFLILETRQ